MKAKFSALKHYIDCGILFLNTKVKLFIESLKETITENRKIWKQQHGNFAAKYSFSTAGALDKERFNKIPDGNSDIYIRVYN